MAKISIRRRNEDERRDGRAALYASFTLDHKKIRIPLDMAVTRQEWDERECCIKGRSQEAQDTNLIISNTIARISDILVKARLSGERLTKELFFKRFNSKERGDNFIEFALQHLKELSPAYAYGTIHHHEAALRKLQQFAPNLKISQITPEWLKIYTRYLRDKLGNCSGTIMKNMCVIRLHYYAAMRAGKVKTNPFEIYKAPRPNPTIVFLSEDELRTLVALYKSGNIEGTDLICLRFFLFLTFTSLHISDARALTIDQIFAGEIHYRRIKTHVQVCVPLSEPARRLIDYYRGNRYRGKLIRELPSDQAFNRIIKRVCRKAGIDKAVSAKAARHTFATIYLRKNSGDLPTLSKIMGHTSINTTMVYAHILKDSRMEGIRIFNEMF